MTDAALALTPPAAAGRRWWRWVALVVGVTVAVLALRGHVPAPAATWAALRRSAPWWLGAAAASSLVSMAAFGEQQRRLLDAFGVRVPAPTMLAVSYARSAMASALPGGSAVSAGYAFRRYRAHGAGQPVAAAVAVLSGLVSVAGLTVLYGADALAWTRPSWSTTAVAGLGVAAAVVAIRAVARPRVPLATSGGSAVSLVPVATPPSIGAAGVATTTRVVAPAESAATSGPVAPTVVAGPIAARSAALGRLLAGLRDAVAHGRTVAGRRWLAVLGLAVVNWATDLACLLASVHAVGLGTPVRTVATAYLAAQLIRQIPATPGGIGVIEASLILALTGAGAASAPAAAAVLVYRLLSCWSVLPIGLACWTRLSRRSPARPPVTS